MVHLFHKRVGAAIGGFVLRALPMAGLVAIAATGDDATPRDGCSGNGAASSVHSDACSSDTLGQSAATGAARILGLGLVGVGVIMASLIDAGALASEPVTPNANVSAAPTRPSLRLTPTASATTSGGMLGLAGTF